MILLDLVRRPKCFVIAAQERLVPLSTDESFLKHCENTTTFSRPVFFPSSPLPSLIFSPSSRIFILWSTTPAQEKSFCQEGKKSFKLLQDLHLADASFCVP